MVIIRGILIVIGVLFIIFGWIISGAYFLIIALYKPIWNRSEDIIPIQNRAKFRLRLFARIIDYVIFSILYALFSLVLENFFPSSLHIIERMLPLVFFVYLLVSLFFFKKTLGDKILNLELVSYNENGKIKWSQIIKRTFFAPIGLFHKLFTIRDSNKYLVHDRIANTDFKKVTN